MQSDISSTHPEILAQIASVILGIISSEQHNLSVLSPHVQCQKPKRGGLKFEISPQEATQSGFMMTPGGQYRPNTMPQVYRNYVDGGGGGGQQRRFKNLEDIVCFKVRLILTSAFSALG